MPQVKTRDGILHFGKPVYITGQQSFINNRKLRIAPLIFKEMSNDRAWLYLNKWHGVPIPPRKLRDIVVRRDDEAMHASDALTQEGDFRMIYDLFMAAGTFLNHRKKKKAWSYHLMTMMARNLGFNPVEET